MICRKDTITYRAKPRIYDINRYFYYILNPLIADAQDLQFVIKGNFLNISNVYLSCDNNSIFNQNQLL